MARTAACTLPSIEPELVKADLTCARNGEGDTVFDWLVEIIRDHGAGSGQAEENVEVVLD